MEPPFLERMENYIEPGMLLGIAIYREHQSHSHVKAEYQVLPSIHPSAAVDFYRSSLNLPLPLIDSMASSELCCLFFSSFLCFKMLSIKHFFV